MTRWRCRAYAALLVDAAAGTLGAAQQQWLERHLDACAHCRDDLAALREVPAQLGSSAVRDPGEAFWLQQRQAISRAIRNAPAPRSRWQLEWLREALRLSPWRYPAAVVASVLVAVFVYQVALPPVAIPPRAALDTEAMAALHDVMQAVVPADEYLPPVSPDDETLLAALPLEGFIGDTAPDVSPADELSDSELDGIEGLIGGRG